MNRASDGNRGLSIANTKWIYILFGFITVFTITTVALTAAVLGVVVNRLDSKSTISTDTSESFTSTVTASTNGSMISTTSVSTNGSMISTTSVSTNGSMISTTSASTTELPTFADQIKITDLMKHLQELQVIADRSNGTRAIATQGFNGTLEYITNQLKQQTNLIVSRQYFTVRNYVVTGTPRLQSSINGTIIDYILSTNFTPILFSSRADFTEFVRVVAIPNVGCQDADWLSVSAAAALAEFLPSRIQNFEFCSPSAADAVALVKRGDCTYPEKSLFAEKYRVRGLLIYNDGIASDRLQPIQGVRNNLNTTIPAYFVSYNLGVQLINAGNNASVMMNIDVTDANGIGNICADTPTGDVTKTIVVGSHSDGVPAGSGINDNGSGTIGNLVLALNLARLFQTSSASYSPYPYRVRFCWWGAEELGLLGARYHVDQAVLSTTTTVGERFQDYLLNFNYDMLAGPNYIFGIHDSSTAPSATPTQALPGTRRITDVFRQWFKEQNLPWSNSSLGGGSDYVPFLAAGLAVGGVNTGAGGTKPASVRDQYTAILGTGNGGIANAAYDPCYHQQCDRITNINPFAYEKVVKAAAYAIEYLGRLTDLEAWLYPQGRSFDFTQFNRDRLNDFHNDPDLIQI